MEDNLGYLFAAFAIAWAGVFAYILFIARKQGQIKRDIDQLKQMLDKGE